MILVKFEMMKQRFSLIFFSLGIVYPIVDGSFVKVAEIGLLLPDFLLYDSLSAPNLFIPLLEGGY